jgi:hypothetical protein
MTPARLAEIKMRYEQKKSFVRSQINMALPGAADLVERQSAPDVRDLLSYVDALTKFAEFCDYHHRSCNGLLGQHLECDCGYTDAREELRAALSQSDGDSDGA